MNESNVNVDNLPESFKVAFWRTTNFKQQSEPTKKHPGKPTFYEDTQPQSNTISEPSKQPHRHKIKPTPIPEELLVTPQPQFQSSKLFPRRSSIRPPDLHFNTIPKPLLLDPPPPPAPEPPTTTEDKRIQTLPETKESSVQVRSSSPLHASIQTVGNSVILCNTNTKSCSST